MKKSIYTTMLIFCINLLQCIGSPLQLIETEEGIRINLYEKPVLNYIKKSHPVPKGLSQHYSRSGYIHPVYSPEGQEVTGDYPFDHAHQHALFFAWTKTKYDGENIDFWNQAKKQGTIEFRNVIEIERKMDYVSFSVNHAFVQLNEKNKKDILNEIWTVKVHKTLGDIFIIDIESVQECVTDKPLTLMEHHYGGMALRFNHQWLIEKKAKEKEELLVMTSEGKGRIDGNHSKAHWVSYSGELDGQDNTITVLSSPQNFRAPQSVRIHPNKPYFCFSPMLEGEFEIKPGEKYRSNYRYLITSKSMDVKLIQEQWKAYIQKDQ